MRAPSPNLYRQKTTNQQHTHQLTRMEASEGRSTSTRIREATCDELGELTSIGVEGLGDSPLFAWLHPQRQRYCRDFWKWRNGITKAHFYDCTSTYYVLVSLDRDETESEIIGYVMLEYDDKERKKLAKNKWSWTNCKLFSYACCSSSSLDNMSLHLIEIPDYFEIVMQISREASEEKVTIELTLPFKGCLIGTTLYPTTCGKDSVSSDL